MGRPGNFDVVRPHDSSSVFDTGMPKDVSPYQPRVAVSVEIQPKSVFKPRRLQRQAKQINGAKWGQTALKNIFGGEENVITNYMAQRLLGIVEGSDRMDQSMMLDDPLLEYREPFNSGTEITSQRQPSIISDQSMIGDVNPTPEQIGNITNLSMGESPLRISITEPSTTPTLEMEAVAEVETQPANAATQGGLMDTIQETVAGQARVSPRVRYLGAGYGNPNRSGTFGLRDDDSV
jgi:hypothetical protein